MLSHWVVIENGKIKNYQCVVPSTWNAGPRNEDDEPGPYEASLLDNPVADPEKPLEVLRTIHSFDPCLACAVHVHDGEVRAGDHGEGGLERIKKTVYGQDNEDRTKDDGRSLREGRPQDQGCGHRKNDDRSDANKPWRCGIEVFFNRIKNCDGEDSANQKNRQLKCKCCRAQAERQGCVSLLPAAKQRKNRKTYRQKRERDCSNRNMLAPILRRRRLFLLAGCALDFRNDAVFEDVNRFGRGRLVRTRRRRRRQQQQGKDRGDQSEQADETARYSQTVRLLALTHQ